MTKFFYATLLSLITIATASLVVPSPGNAQDNEKATDGEPVLLELFTSQGCSSCPPADKLAAQLATEPGLVVISRPVDYWDRLGWKDTLARSENTDLQRAYARMGLGGYNGVYTPQIVTKGRLGEVGSSERAIRSHIAQLKPTSKAAIRIRRAGTGDYSIGMAGKTARQAELVLIGVSSREIIDIGRGENRGRQIAYTNVLIDERPLAKWSGGKSAHVIAVDELTMPGADRYAVVLRQPNGGEVLAARWLN